MALVRHHGGWTIAITLIVAFMLTILPLPDWAEHYRPEWAALVILYWAMALPERIGVGIGWIIGLLLDVMKGALLGQHALGLAVIIYLTINLHQRLRVFPLWQQSFTIILLLLLYQLLILWFNGIIGEPAKGWEYWMPSITGMLLWPWVFILLRSLRRHFKVT